MKHEFKEGDRVVILGKSVGAPLDATPFKRGDIATVHYIEDSGDIILTRKAILPGWSFSPKDLLRHDDPECYDISASGNGIVTVQLIQSSVRKLKKFFNISFTAKRPPITKGFKILQNLFYLNILSRMFNIYNNGFFWRRALISKSGFLGRAGKRRKGI